MSQDLEDSVDGLRDALNTALAELDTLDLQRIGRSVGIVDDAFRRLHAVSVRTPGRTPDEMARR